jgi:hypothetical protein
VEAPNPIWEAIESVLDFLSTMPEGIIIGFVLLLLFRRRKGSSTLPTFSPFQIRQRRTQSTSILCNNCGLANPSVWEKCERCGAPLGTATAPTPPPDAELPPLIKKI